MDKKAVLEAFDATVADLKKALITQLDDDTAFNRTELMTQMGRVSALVKKAFMNYVRNDGGLHLK